MFKHDSPVNFFFFYAANFFFSAAYFLLFPIIPVYVHGIQAGVLGLVPVIVTYFLATIIAAPIIGYFIDWHGRLRFALFGAVASAVFTFSYSIAKSMLLVLIIRFLHGIAVAAFNVAILTILTDATENSWRGEILGAYYVPQLFWTAIGAAFALFILPFGTKVVFGFAALLGLASVLFTFFIKRPKIFALSRQSINIAEFLTYENILVMAGVFVLYAVYSALLTNIEQYIPQIQGDALGGFFTWFVIAGLLVLYNAGNLSDRIGRGYAALLGFSFLAVSISVVLMADKKATATLSGVLFGIAYAIILPALTTWWMDIVPIPKRGLSMGIFQSVQGIGMLIGLWILNLFGFIGPKGIFSAALVFVLAIIFAIGYRQWPELKAKFVRK